MLLQLGLTDELVEAARSQAGFYGLLIGVGLAGIDELVTHGAPRAA
jgi:hypothetical protein